LTAAKGYAIINCASSVFIALSLRFFAIFNEKNDKKKNNNNKRDGAFVLLNSINHNYTILKLTAFCLPMRYEN
jgi:hypothetical protein